MGAVRKKTLIIGVVAGILLVTAVAADRFAAAAAAERLAGRLRCATGLPSEPSVSFGGFPFLTQLPGGRFDSIRITATDVPAGRFRATVEATATGVRLREGEALQVSALTAEILIGYGHLRDTQSEAESLPPMAAPRASALPGGFSGDLAADGSGRLLLSATRTLFGQEIPVTVVAAPEIIGTRLTIRPIEVEIPSVGLRLPAERFPALRQLPTVDLPALPAGLSYTAVTAEPDGLALTVGGTGISTGDLTEKAAGRCGGLG